MLYNNIIIDSKTVEAVSIKLFHAVKKLLKSKSLDPMLRMKFCHDVHWYIFCNRGFPSRIPGAILLQKEDFQRMMLPSTSLYTLDKQGGQSGVSCQSQASPKKANPGIQVKSQRVFLYTIV